MALSVPWNLDIAHHAACVGPGSNTSPALSVGVCSRQLQQGGSGLEVMTQDLAWRMPAHCDAAGNTGQLDSRGLQPGFKEEMSAKA